MDDALASGPARRLSDGRVLAIMAAMAAAVLLTAVWATHTVNPLRADSAGYLYFDPSRSVGYPAFLELIRLATGHVVLAVPAQMILLAGSLLLLALNFYRFSGRTTLSLAFAAVLLIQPGSWFAAAFLMTEALSTALVALWCAQLLRMARSPSPHGTATLAIVSALAMTVRPSLVALFFASALFVLAARPVRPGWKSTLILAAAFVISWAATPVSQLIVHGSSTTTSPFARGVLQHTLYCDPRGIASDPDSRLVEEESAPVRRYIETAPADMREQLRREYATPLRFGSIIPQLGRRHGLDRLSRIDPDLAPIAAARVAANPLCYVASVAREYARLAIFATDPTTEDARAINDYVRAHPPVEVPQFPVPPGDEYMARQAADELHRPLSRPNPQHRQLHVVGSIPLAALLPLRLLVAASALLGLLALIALPMRQRMAPGFRQIIPLAAAMGLAFHGTLVITAIVEIGFYRYLVPLWPIACTLIALAIDYGTGRGSRGSLGHAPQSHSARA